MIWTATVNLTGTMTVGDLIKAIEKIPEDAKFSIDTFRGDRPGETSYSKVTFRWNV